MAIINNKKKRNTTFDKFTDTTDESNGGIGILDTIDYDRGLLSLRGFRSSPTVIVNLVDADSNNATGEKYITFTSTGGVGGIPAVTVSPASDDNIGVVGALLSFAREDHKHPAQGISIDANNGLVVGTDGLHFIPNDIDEVIENVGVLSGAAPSGAQWGVDTSTGQAYYVSGGNWVAMPISTTDLNMTVSDEAGNNVGATPNNPPITPDPGDIHLEVYDDFLVWWSWSGVVWVQSAQVPTNPLASTSTPLAPSLLGNVGASVLYTREDHKHPYQGISLDANNSLTVGTDGLHYASAAVDEVIENAGVLSGAAPAGAHWGVDTTTGVPYYVSGGNWTAASVTKVTVSDENASPHGFTPNNPPASPKAGDIHVETYTNDTAWWVYNGATWVESATQSDPLPAALISPASDDAAGALGVSLLFAREDHKHPAQGISVDAGNKLTVGSDGLHMLLNSGNNRQHVKDSVVVPAIAGNPTIAEIQSAVNSATITDTLVYYTGDNLSGSSPTYVYWVDAAGIATTVSSPFTNSWIENSNATLTGNRNLDVNGNQFRIVSLAGQTFVVTGAGQVFVASGAQSTNMSGASLNISNTTTNITSQSLITANKSINFKVDNTLTIQNNSGIGAGILIQSANGQNVNFRVPDNIPVGYKIILPSAGPTAVGQILVDTDGAGTLKWAAGGGGGTDTNFAITDLSTASGTPRLHTFDGSLDIVGLGNKTMKMNNGSSTGVTSVSSVGAGSNILLESSDFGGGFAASGKVNTYADSTVAQVDLSVTSPVDGKTRSIGINNDVINIVTANVEQGGATAGQVLSLISVGGNVEFKSITASQIGNVPAGNIVATDAQAAINELDVEKLNVTNPSMLGSFTEQVYNLVGTDIDPLNGTMQWKVLGGNTTFTESLSEGTSLTFMLDIGGNTAAWPASINWLGGATPILSPIATNAIIIWRVNAVVYGSFLGNI